MGNLIRIAEAAELTGISKGSIYKAINSNTLPYSIVYGLLLVDDETVKQFATNIKKYNFLGKYKRP